MSPLQELLSKRIIQLRKRKAWSQERLAVEAGLSLRYLQYLEKGEKWAGPEILEDIARVLEVEPWELFCPREIPQTTLDQRE